MAEPTRAELMGALHRVRSAFFAAARTIVDLRAENVRLRRELASRTAERDAYETVLDGYVTITDAEVEQFFEETDR